jgi:hypothetical protein
MKHISDWLDYPHGDIVELESDDMVVSKTLMSELESSLLHAIDRNRYYEDTVSTLHYLEPLYDMVLNIIKQSESTERSII